MTSKQALYWAVSHKMAAIGAKVGLHRALEPDDYDEDQLRDLIFRIGDIDLPTYRDMKRGEIRILEPQQSDWLATCCMPHRNVVLFVTRQHIGFRSQEDQRRAILEGDVQTWP